MPKDRERNDETTSRISGAELAQLAELAKASPGFDDHLEALAEWEGDAIGTPQQTPLPGVSRASTRHDPLTTAVLAQIAREANDETPPKK